MSTVVKLENSKLKKLITDKGLLIEQGRGVSEEIEKLEKEMEEIDTQLKEIEKSVDISDLKAKGELISTRVEECIKEMRAVEEEVRARMKEKSPTELVEKYDLIKKTKEERENDRNKIALKAQKFNDKIIPLGRKLMKPYLKDEFDDYDTIKIENEEIVCTIFSHLEDFKNNFKKK